MGILEIITLAGLLAPLAVQGLRYAQAKIDLEKAKVETQRAAANKEKRLGENEDQKGLIRDVQSSIVATEEEAAGAPENFADAAAKLGAAAEKLLRKRPDYTQQEAFDLIKAYLPTTGFGALAKKQAEKDKQGKKK